MIFKSICLAAALFAAPTYAVVPSSNSTKLSDDTDEPKRRLGAVDDGAYQRRDLAETKSAFVLLDSGGAYGFGHVAGCFEDEEGKFKCFSDDGPEASPQFWIETKANQAEVLSLFQGKGYTDWKRLDVYNANPAQAMTKLNKVKDMEYNLLWRNCQNDVYDVLHDEGSGFGITANSVFRNNGCYIGWYQEVNNPGPNHWFHYKIAATETAKFRSGENGKCLAYLGSSDEYCVSGLTCCGGKCKKKVNKRWCVAGWWSWTCFDNWTCP